MAVTSRAIAAGAVREEDRGVLGIAVDLLK
jgi:hypothetical protein